MTADWKRDISQQLATLSGLKVEDYSYVDFGREKNSNCIHVLIEETKTGNPFQAVAARVGGVFANQRARKDAEELMANARVKLPSDYVAFVGTTQWLGSFKPNGVELVVGPGESQFDIIRHAKSDACNYDMSTDDLIERLEKYHKEFGINITHAETDTIDIELLKLPESIEAFAEDLYDFCPDLIDQGCGSLPALVAEIKSSRKITLWWD